MIPPILMGIASLAERYDVFVVDLWGTLHDGVRAYPGAADALSRLARMGKRVALLSNAPRRVGAAERTLAAVGIAPHLYGLVVTSGEAAHTALRDRVDPWHLRLEGPCWHLGAMGDRSVFEGLDLALRRGPDGAGFCLATGVERNEETVDDYRPMLDRGLKLGLPMICANPDIVVPVGDALVVCAGAFARDYAERGGDVFWHGKPHRPIYERVFAGLEALGGGPVDPERTIAVGDGLPTDILGAAGAGIASALVLNGIHADEVKRDGQGRPDPDSLAGLFGAAPARPDFVLPRLTW